MIDRSGGMPVQVGYQLSTSNRSFLEMHWWLKSQGREKNKFFLMLYDTALANINPRDPNLNDHWKARVLRECCVNEWYFLREVLRIPDTGGEVGGGAQFRLDRGNLALLFCLQHNWNAFLEEPRQFGKTTGAIAHYLWVFNFGTRNSKMMFIHKKHDGSKENLQRLKDMRAALPSYLRMDQRIDDNGKRLKATDNATTLEHLFNGNKITTMPGARNASNANNLGRGATMPIHWYDEYAFMLYNKTIYNAATPAYKAASKSAMKYGKPFGILITTTPGILTTDEGVNAFKTRNAATPFNEDFYDRTPKQLEEIKAANTSSSFFHIKYTYQQLGAGDDYLKEMVIDLEKDWDAIRREVLLEWAITNSNSPFTKQDLDVVKGLVRAPRQQLRLGNLGSPYYLNIYDDANIRIDPPIIGVDVSGGYEQDSSAITIIDSRTTKVLATFNCNFISIDNLAKVIYEIVVKYMPTAIINIERNGGFGASLLQKLIATKLKRNLYFEIKDKVVEERNDGFNTVKRKKRCKCYGFDNTAKSRELLMEILRDRMENHKDKFAADIIYNELCTLEVKKNGRIEHASNAHDDQIFSLLMALYVWYEGKNLMENFGLRIRQIYTDKNVGDIQLEEDYTDISGEDVLSLTEEVQEQIEMMNTKANSMSYREWEEQENAKDLKAMEKILSTKVGRDAYVKQFNADPDDLMQESMLFTIPNEVFMEDTDKKISNLQKQFDNITNLR